MREKKMRTFNLTPKCGHDNGESADQPQDIATTAKLAARALHVTSLGSLAAAARELEEAGRALARDLRLFGATPSEIVANFPNAFRSLTPEFIAQEAESAEAGLERLTFTKDSVEQHQALLRAQREQVEERRRDSENLAVLADAERARQTKGAALVAPRRGKGELAPWAIAWVRVTLPLHRILAGLEGLGIADQYIDEDLNLSFSAPMVVDAIEAYDPVQLPEGITDRQLIADQLRLAYPNAEFRTKRPKQMAKAVRGLSEAYEAGTIIIRNPRDADRNVRGALLPILRPKI